MSKVKEVEVKDSNLMDLSQEERIEELCQRIFGKSLKDVKYVYVTNHIHEQLLKEELARTGLYQWVNVFDGVISKPEDIDDYNEFDIVQVNMAGQDLHLINDIKRELKPNSGTVLVVNNDYTTELWGAAFDFPTTIERELAGADVLFGTEYYQTTALTEIARRKAFIIPHPADIKRLKSTKDDNKKKSFITTLWRRYDNFSYIPSLVVRNHGLRTRLIGYDKNKDPKSFLTTAIFDDVFPGTNCFEFDKQMRESKIVYNPFTFHSFDRSTVECAAMGVAVVGSDRTQSMRICYPFTCVDPYDVTKARKLIERLNTDEEFYNKVVQYAFQASEYYNHVNSCERYLLAVYDSLGLAEKYKEDVKPVADVTTKKEFKKEDLKKLGKPIKK